MKTIRHCVWGKVRAGTTFNSRPGNGYTAVPVGEGNGDACQHAGYFPVYCSHTMAKLRSPVSEVARPGGALHLWMPVGADPSYDGTYNGHAPACEAECGLTVTGEEL